MNMRLPSIPLFSLFLAIFPLGASLHAADAKPNIVENPVHVRDLHATMLHLLGIDHRRLTFPYQGLDQKLTGVEASRVVRDIIS
jgi:hypothetical protein